MKQKNRHSSIRTTLIMMQIYKINPNKTGFCINFYYPFEPFCQNKVCFGC